MSKTVIVKARIEPQLKEEVENLFRTLGLSPAEAINIFYSQVKLRHGLPFPIVVPNEKTIQVFKDTDVGENIIYSLDEYDLFEKLEI
ncbi:MAG: type II toxin-antitoxin system RelB/DinJ family antitoxin [bacterium]